MNMAKRFVDIRSQSPVSAKAKALAHLENLAEDTGVPLPELRCLNDLTLVELARRLAVTLPSVSEIERSDSPAIPTVRRYVEAIGAHLEIIAVFEDGRRVLLDV
jgi:predicted transcriptional regulator